MNLFARLKQTLTNLVAPNPEMFGHEASPGETCYVCGKSMTRKIIQVGSGERMHGDCWGDFMERRFMEITERYGRQRAAQRKGEGK